MGQGEGTWGDAAPRFRTLILLGIGGRGWVGTLSSFTEGFRFGF